LGEEKKRKRIHLEGYGCRTYRTGRTGWGAGSALSTILAVCVTPDRPHEKPAGLFCADSFRNLQSRSTLPLFAVPQLSGGSVRLCERRTILWRLNRLAGPWRCCCERYF
jgi:hypothetical protein